MFTKFQRICFQLIRVNLIKTEKNSIEVSDSWLSGSRNG